MSHFGKYPAIVKSWDRARRECRVAIPGFTDGAQVFPLAELMYSLGDKSENTEIRIIVGDRVWVEFERGDPRYPIIVGFRTKRTGNDLLWRREAHENFERHADDGDIHDHASHDILTEAGHDMVTQVSHDEHRTIGNEFTLDAESKITLHVGSSTLVIEDGKVTITTPEHDIVATTTNISGALNVHGLLTYTAGLAGSGGGASAATITGNMTITGGEVTVDGKGVKSHHHQEHDGPNTGPALA